MKKFIRLLIVFSLVVIPFLFNGQLSAQRKMEYLDRGVVAVKNNSGGYFISWRYLAQDPEDVLYNVYAQLRGGTYVKLNPEPLSVTNLTATSSQLGAGGKVYVTTVIDGVEGSPSKEFSLPTRGYTTLYRSAFLDITYDPAKDGLELHKYSTKFIWPADLDGDGEYDYVVDRLSTDGTNTHKVQGYLRDGTLLWTIDMGPNVPISQGHNDMVIAYDMDGDNKAEVIIKSSDGTVFANGKGVNGIDAPYDSDGDGIVNYDLQNTRNQPHYITVIDGLTGIEKNTIAMKLPSNYTRDNKASFMGTEYSSLNGHMGILYLDGKRPSVGYVYLTRTLDKQHWYYASTYGYDKNGSLVNWWNWERGLTPAAEGHGIRVADVTLDGRDELLDIGYGLKYDGTLAFNANISHGDRFRTGDLNPERPGLETFAIQQNAPSMLGQLIYDAATGEAIHKYYLSSVGDVGRGECMDIDPTRIGYEFWSTMPNIYDAQGNILFEGNAPFPHEGVWWDGELDREDLSSPDGNGFNADVRKFVRSNRAFSNRLIEFAKMTNYTVKSEYGVRPAFFGDIIGDWREEVILEKRGSVLVNGVSVETNPGFVGFSTDYPTIHRIYCLMQNPAYRNQATTKGYYQSPFPDFYLGYDMPTPPIPPIHTAKLTWDSGTAFDLTSPNFVLQDDVTKSVFANGDDVMFDISGDNSAIIQINSDIAPSKLWAMNPKGKDYELGGSGKLTGTMELVKSQNGKFTLNGNHNYTGKTLISEGILCLNGSSSSEIDLRAKGTLMGNVVLNGGIILHPGLNVEGGRLSPGNGLDLGKITINSTVVLPGKSTLEFDINPDNPKKNDSIHINGDFTANGVNNIVINGSLNPGIYSLITWTGTFSGSKDNFNILGISGLPVRMLIAGNEIQLIVEETRSASDVIWTGSTDSNWDYLTENFKTIDTPQQNTFFVQNDSVVFDDSALSTSVNLTESMIANGIYVNNNTKSYIFTGAGGIGGTGGFVKEGKGLLDLGNIQSTYTGKTLFTNSLVRVSGLNQSSVAGVLGQASVNPANWVMTDSRLIVDAVNSNTDRGLTIQGTDTIDVPRSNGVVSITGIVTGSGGLVKEGAGQLNLSSSSPNSYSGETVIKGGTVGLGTLEMNRTGFGKSGVIRMENGARIRMFDNSADYNQRAVWYITIPENNTARIDASSRCNINGTISGAGTLNFYVPYVRNDLVASGADFTGTINVTGRDFRITANPIAFPLASINLGDNVFMGAYSSIGASGTNNSQVVKLGSLAGAASSKVGGGNWHIGSNNKDAVFDGSILPGATVTKLGTGSWTLTNASTTTNSFVVSDGTLVVRNRIGGATGTGTLSVRNSASLIGTGTLDGNVLMTNSSVVMPGLTETNFGILNFNKNLTLTPNTTAIIKVGSSSNDKLKVGGILYLNGTLDMRNLGGLVWADGMEFKIFEAPNITGNFSTILPETPGDNLIWDTSRINEGIIAVKTPSSVKRIDASQVSIYPQPVGDFCFVSIENENAASVLVEVFNSNGSREIVKSEVLGTNQIKLNVSNLSEGVYLIRLTNSENAIFTQKIIKE
ncbi:MAG: T9SS type A sorting domain-containing protein [Porphyromonadaceae bacterium]|nr:T9SS type A sorting domain-containing protein [Porphyromonadaceae bacterium]